MKKKRRELIYSIMLLCVTLLAMLLVLELFFRLYLGSNLRYDYTEDTLWELEPSQTGFALPNGVFATINSDGFRGPEISIDKPADIERIALLGGSIGFGWGVADNETLAAQLEKSLIHTQVLNLGEAGYGIAQMIAKYEKIGEKYEPDTVILLFASSNVLAQPDLDRSTRLKSMIVRKLLRKSTLAAYLKPKLGFLRYYITGVGKQNETMFLEYWPKDAQRILAFNDELKSENKELILLPYTFKPEHELFYETVKEFGEEYDIAVTGALHPILEEYRKSNDSGDIVVEDGHPSALQFSFAARVVIDALGEHDG